MSSSGTYKERTNAVSALLQQACIDLKAVRDNCSTGVPDALRPLCWRVLLDYLPVRRSEWTEFLRQRRTTYADLVLDIIVKPGQGTSIDEQHNTYDDSANDHPLSLSPTSAWSAYFQDNQVLLQIDRDVRRLCPEISFFQQATNYPNWAAAKLNLSARIDQCFLKSETFEINRSGAANLVQSAQSRKVASYEYKPLTGDSEGVEEANWQVVERILFIYSKLNPGVKYVQGMNEILGPLYYVFARDTDGEWAKYAEADTYYCFQNLMSEIKDNFITTLDSSNCGIEWRMTQLYDRFKAVLPELYSRLVTEQSLIPQYFAFRWLSLLLSQEFLLPDVITVWDSLFAATDRNLFLHCLCLAMLANEKSALMDGDFSTNLRLLQNYPDVDVGQLIVSAHDIQQKLIELESAVGGDIGVHNNSDNCSGAKKTKGAMLTDKLSSTFRSLTGTNK